MIKSVIYYFRQWKMKIAQMQRKRVVKEINVQYVL